MASPYLVFEKDEKLVSPRLGCRSIAEVGTHKLDLADGRSVPFDVEAHAYREQRLTVNRSYVSLSEENLARVGAERKVIDAALNNHRSTPLEDIALDAPVDGPRSSSFGLRRFFNDEPRSPHKGMDIAATTGTPIVAPKTGVVTATGDFFFNGNTVIVDHGQGLVTMYCHLSEIDVEEGATLAQGEKLGEVGATGRVTRATPALWRLSQRDRRRSGHSAPGTAMKIGKLINNLLSIGLLAASGYVIWNWQDFGSSKSDVEIFAERACVDAVNSSYNVSNVSPYEISESDNGYVVRLSVTTSRGTKAKAICLTNPHGGRPGHDDRGALTTQT